MCAEIGSKSNRCGIQVGAPILLFNGMTPNNAVDRTPGSAWRRYAVVLVAGAGHGKRLGIGVAKWYTIYMSRADRLKEEIGWLKVAFGIAVALDASLVAWLAQNYATASPIIVGAGLIAVLVIAVMIVLINRWAYRRIEELENV